MGLWKIINRLTLMLGVMGITSILGAEIAKSEESTLKNEVNAVSNLMYAVNPPGVNIPGISQAMVVNDGKIMYLSGHIAMGADGNFVGDTVEEQLKQVMANMAYTLKEAGADFSNVARLTVYVRDYDISMLEGIRKIRDQFVNQDLPPASALIGVAALFHPGALVEVDAVVVF